MIDLAKKKGKSKPSGKLDTQLFPECKGTKYDRDIVKKTVERRKHSFNLKQYKTAQDQFCQCTCGKCDCKEKILTAISEIEKEYMEEHIKASKQPKSASPYRVDIEPAAFVTRSADAVLYNMTKLKKILGK